MAHSPYIAESITMPDSVTSIGESVFNSCGLLSSVTIPGGIERIGCNAFAGCCSLLDIYFKGSKHRHNIEKENYWDDTPNYIIHCRDGNIKK